METVFNSLAVIITVYVVLLLFFRTPFGKRQFFRFAAWAGSSQQLQNRQARRQAERAERKLQRTKEGNS